MYADKNIKEKILNEIESLPETEQQTVLGIVENYIHGKAVETDWEQLPEAWKKRIQESMKQGDEGKHILTEDVVEYIKKKHGLND